MEYIVLTICPSTQPVQPIPQINSTNYARDANSIMTPKSQFNFFVRGLLQFCFYMSLQLPKQLGVQIDKDKFLSAFTMNDGETSIQADCWTYGPSGPVRQSQPLSPMQSARQAVQQTYANLHSLFAKSLPLVRSSYSPSSQNG